MSAPNVCVLNAQGINCNQETAFAFEQAGGRAEQVHISQLVSGDRSLDDYQIFALSGGFSYGDDIQSGRILGLEIQTQMSDELNRFVAASGLIIGICNGFQVLTETGLLPTGQINPRRSKKVSLVHNQNGQFIDNWCNLLVEDSRCVFIDDKALGHTIELPIAHGEGRVVGADDETLWRLDDNHQVVFRYINEQGEITEEFPDNPNGSFDGITGICDETGQVLGMMPHPERFVTPTQHPNWRRRPDLVAQGLPIFKAMVRTASE